MRVIRTLCYFIMGTLWTQMSPMSLKHQMNGLKLLPTHKGGGLTFTKWKTQVDVVVSPTALCLCLEHKESNTRLIVSHMFARQFHQMKTMLKYVHMEVGIFSTKTGIRGKIRTWRGRTLLKSILLRGSMCRRSYLLESQKDPCMRSY